MRQRASDMPFAMAMRVSHIRALLAAVPSDMLDRWKRRRSLCLRIKISGAADGAVKLEMRVPAGFLQSIASFVPQVLDLRVTTSSLAVKEVTLTDPLEPLETLKPEHPAHIHDILQIHFAGRRNSNVWFKTLHCKRNLHPLHPRVILNCTVRSRGWIWMSG